MQISKSTSILVFSILLIQFKNSAARYILGNNNILKVSDKHESFPSHLSSLQHPNRKLEVSGLEFTSIGNSLVISVLCGVCAVLISKLINASFHNLEDANLSGLKNIPLPTENFEEQPKNYIRDYDRYNVKYNYTSKAKKVPYHKIRKDKEDSTFSMDFRKLLSESAFWLGVISTGLDAVDYVLHS